MHLVQMPEAGWYKSKLYTGNTSNVKHFSKSLITNFIKPFWWLTFTFFQIHFLHKFQYTLSVEIGVYEKQISKLNAHRSLEHVSHVHMEESLPNTFPCPAKHHRGMIPSDLTNHNYRTQLDIQVCMNDYGVKWFKKKLLKKLNN